MTDKQATPIFWPAPIAWEDATAVQALCAVLRDPDASIYALRLWHHARRCGYEVDTVDNDATIERICRWRGKRGRLARALWGEGFVTIDEDGDHHITPWRDIAAVDWTRPGADEPDDSIDDEPDEDRHAREQRLARDRQQRRRDRQRDDGVTRHGGERDGNVTKRDGDRDERDESGVNGRFNPRAPTCATQTETQTDTNTLKELPSDADAPPVVSDGGQSVNATTPSAEQPTLPGVSPVGSGAENAAEGRDGALASKPAPLSAADQREADVTAVLESWRTVTGKTKCAIEGPKARDRRRRIASRIKDGWSVADLVLVAKGAMLDDWYSGRDPKSKPEGYLEVDNIYLDNERCEKLLAKANGDVKQRPPVDRFGKPVEPERPRPALFVAPPPMTDEQKAASRAAMEKAKAEVRFA